MTEALKVLITAEMAEFKKGIKSGKDELKSFVKEGTKDLGALKDEFKKYGDASSKFLKGSATAVAGAAAAFLALGPATAELRTNQAKLKTAFETAGGSAKIATDTYNDLYRVLGDDGRAVEAAQHLAKLTTNQKELDQWTKITQGVFGTFGDSLPIESLTEAVNHTAQLGEVQGSLADALEWAGVSVDDFNAQLLECNTTAEREALIRETLGGLYNEAAESYEKNAADIMAQNEAQAKMNEALAQLGAAAAPIIAILAQFAAEALAPMMPHIQAFADQYGPSIKETLGGIAEGIGATIGWIADNWGLVSTLGTIILAIAAALVVANAAITVHNAIMAASPTTWIILAVVAAIAVLVAAVVLCIKYWDEIKGAASAAWEWIKGVWQGAGDWFADIWTGIKNAFAAVGSWFADIFSAAWTGIKNAWSATGSWFSSCWAGIQNAFSAVGSWFSNIFRTAWDGIKRAFSGVSSFFSGVWTSIKEIFSKAGSAIGGAIKDTVSKAVNSVLSTAVKIINGFISAINLAIGVINAIPGVSISKLKTLSVPAMAKGGFVDSATLALIGERGKEAVLPLENNLGYLDKLAELITSRMGGSSSKPIYLTVDKRVLGQVTAEGINDITRRTGRIPLVTM